MTYYTHPLFFLTTLTLILNFFCTRRPLATRSWSSIVCFLWSVALACTVSLIADLPLWNQVLTISNWLAISLMIIAALFGLTSFIYYRIKDKQILAEQAHNQFFNCEQSDDEQKLTMSYNLFSRFRGVTVRTAIVFVVGFSLILVTYGLSYFTYLLTQHNDTTLGPVPYGLFLYIQGSFIAILLNMGIQLLIESISEWN